MKALRMMPAVLIMVLAIPVIALNAEANETHRKTLDMSADGLVMVENLAGKVKIESWDKNQAEVVVEAGDDVEEVIIEPSSNGIHVVIRNKSSSRNIDDTDIHIRAPGKASIEVVGVSADIQIDGFASERINLQTVSGDIDVRADAGHLEVESVSGDVEFDGTTQRASASSVSGDVVILGVEREVEINTVSGDATVRAGSIVQGRFEAVSGDINLDMEVAEGGRLRCDSMSGDISIRLPESQQAELSAQSYSGDIRSDFGKSERVSRGAGAMLDYTAGSNGARVRAESFSGNISIRKQ